jgi:hypothetical protein
MCKTSCFSSNSFSTQPQEHFLQQIIGGRLGAHGAQKMRLFFAP